MNHRLELTDLQRLTRERLLADVGELPVLPHVVIELLNLRPSDPRYFEDVERLVAGDPRVATRLLGLANSAAQRGISEVRSIPEALVRLGARGVASLVMTLGLAKAMNPKKKDERALWLHSLEVAHVASALGRLVARGEVTPEELYLAGLLHDIGRFVLFVETWHEVMPLREGEWEHLSDALHAEISACGVDHCELGGLACKHWNMPDIVCQVARYHHLPESAPVDPSTRRGLELVVAADHIVSRAELLPAGAFGSAKDERSLKIVQQHLPRWAAVEAASLIEPLREAREAAQKACRSMGVRT